jgi:hypothetical protein
MNKHLTIPFCIGVLLLSGIGSSLAQTKDVLKAKWPVGTTQESHGFTLLRETGDNAAKQITNISYMPLPLLIEEAKTTAETEKWTAEELATRMNKLQGQGSGGRVQVYISRLTIEAANASNFMLLVENEQGKELYREEFDSETALQSGGKSNLFEAYIPIEIGSVFYVSLIDELSKPTPSYRFLIRKKD